MRRHVRQAHLWLGLSLGLLLVMLGITGSALVFYTDIDRFLHPEIQVSASAKPDFDRALATVRAQWPGKTGPWRFEVTGDGGAIPARYYNPPETAHRDFAPMMVWLSPDGEKVLRRDYWGDYAMTFIHDLHYRLLLGKTGGMVLGYAGLALFLFLLTGLAAWWPRGSWRKALRYKGDASQSRRLRDIHKLSGLWGLALLLMLTVTGVMLALPDESDAVLSATIGPIDATPKPPATYRPARSISVRQAMATAKRALPKAGIAWVEVPGHDAGMFKVRMKQPNDPSRRFPHSFVWIDRYNAEVHAVTDAQRAGRSSTINNWVHPLHDGSAGGLLLRIANVVTGFVSLILFITGWMRWRSRGRLTRSAPLKTRSTITPSSGSLLLVR